MDTKTMTVQQALEDPKFSYFFKDEIKRLQTRRAKIIKEHSGGRLKSDAFSTLDKLGYFICSESIQREYYAICNKQSILSKRERDWVEDLVRVIIGRIILFYDDEKIVVKKPAVRKQRAKKEVKQNEE